MRYGQCRSNPTVVAKMNPLKVKKDKYGVKLKFPDRSCQKCQKYPCFPEITKCSSDFAAYGCTYYKEPRIT